MGETSSSPVQIGDVIAGKYRVDRLDQGLSTPSGVAVDDKAVYWTNTYAAGGGAVYKRAKP